MTIMQNLGALNRQYEANQGAKDFAHLALLMALAPDNLPNAAKMADAATHASPRLRTLLKTAVSAGTMGDSAWASPLVPYGPLTDGFLESLRGRGVFDSAVPFMLPVPMKTNLIVAAGGNASMVDEASPAPVTTLSMALGAIEPLKAIGFVVVTRELLRHGLRSVALVQRELTKAVIQAVDTKFLTDVIATLTPIPSSGQTTDSFLQDLASLLHAVVIGADAQLFLAAHTDIVKQLATKATLGGAPAFPTLGVNGGNIAGIEVIPTNTVASGVMILFDAAQIASDPGSVILNTSDQGAIQMVTNPSGAASMVSLFQTNSSAIRAVRQFGYLRGRTTAAAVITGATYDDAQSG